MISLRYSLFALTLQLLALVMIRPSSSTLSTYPTLRLPAAASRCGSPRMPACSRKTVSYVNLVVIAAGTAAIGALASGDVEILGAPGSTTMLSAARGLPFAIIGTFGPSAWKLAAHPSITNVEQLRGKTVGISRPGTTVEFATRRALVKLGLSPGKDVNILATGLAESNKRLLVMHQGKIDATLVSPDNLYEAEQKGMKISILADLKDLGIYTSASDLSAKRDFLKNQRQRARGFMMAFCEAIALGRANQQYSAGEFSQAYARERSAPVGQSLQKLRRRISPDQAFPDGRGNSDRDRKHDTDGSRVSRQERRRLRR